MKKWIITLNLLFYITFLNQWNFVESHPTSSSSDSTTTQTTESTDTITTVTLDISKSSSTSEFNYTDENGVVTYSPKSGHVFNKVTQGSMDIWVSTNVYSSLVMLKTIKDAKSTDGVCRILVILMTNNIFTLFKEENSIFKDITATRPDITKLRFLGENDAELTSSDYNVSIVDLSYTFTFDDASKCVKITYNDNEVWKHTDDPKFNTIKKLKLGLVSNKFYVINSSDESNQLSKPKITMVALDISKTQSTSEFDYTDRNGIVTYTAKSDNLFDKVSQGTIVVWESKDYVYGTLVRVMSDESKKYLAILLTNNMFKVFHEDAGNWTEISDDQLPTDLKTLIYPNSTPQQTQPTTPGTPSTTPSSGTGTPASQSETTPPTTSPTLVTALTTDTITPVTLDINKSKDTNELYFKKDGNFRTYTPKDDHVFSKIIKKPLVTSTVEIWTAEPDDHGLKAVLMGSGRNEKYLSILLQSGNFVLLRKSGKNKPWEDITSDRHDVTNLKFFGENDVELSSSDFKVTLHDLSYEYTFNDGVICKKITYTNVPLWIHSDDPNYSSIKSLQLDLPNNKFSVMNSSDQTKQLDIKLTLDIEKTQSTTEFEYTDQNGLITFTAKDSHLFNKITQGTTVIWVSTGCLYGTLVMSKTVYGVKFLAILMTNNIFTLFHLDGVEWHITSKRRDVSKLKFLGDNDVELKSSDYTVRTVFLSFIYKFNSGVVCKKIKLADADIWKHTDDPGFSEIKIFSIGLISNSFFVFNNKNESKKLNIKITLNLSALQKSETTDKFDITDHNGVDTYRPKSGYLLSSVTDGTATIWESTANEGATQVRIRSSDDAKYLAIVLSDDNFKFFKKESDDWTEITDDNLLREHTPNFTASKSQTQTSSTTPDSTHTPAEPAVTSATKVTLDLNTTESTSEFNYTDQNNVIVYKPKDNHVFSKVSNGSTDIWESKTNVYGRLVMLMTLDVKYLAILLTNNMFKLFKERMVSRRTSPIPD
ncbi:SfiI-subtelomeric fragment related protein family member, putative [Theileria annulata]|uniref:SfiI-subtelomeric related protein family member, putative n=1 Tax=Theileria annulata TaxID=5874 RepID=Q4UAS4_THEAN|nr:SfiI-subtelomeric fragment related protein family member, putative [Theileria annulata]CAI76077.1 SfiI-subtelomeric fragment related protein family member, putative [Theileria annulata]